MRQSQAWKNLERSVAEALGGTRVLRGADFSESDVDVKVDDFPLLAIDCKYRKSHAFHSLIEEIRTKYCGDGTKSPVLVTKHKNGQRNYVSMDLELLQTLLNIIRENGEN